MVYCQLIRHEKCGVLSDHENKIKLIEDRDATGEVADVYDAWRAKSGRQQMPGILNCFNRVADAFGIAPQGYLEMNGLAK
jgi:hypothetical protein